ncbi:MAG: hypothetical protein ACLP29_08335 [Dissulfurispiraceae bacterium]|jgi:hypothetical protein
MVSANDPLFVGQITFGITIWAGLSDLNESIFTFVAPPIPYKGGPVAECALLIAIIPASIFTDGTFHHMK